MVSEQAAPKLAKSADSTEGAMIAFGVIVGEAKKMRSLEMQSSLYMSLNGVLMENRVRLSSGLMFSN